MHEDRDGHIHVSQEEASGGSKDGVVRWVLLLGILLAIGLLSVTWITGALTQEEVEEEGDVSGRISAEQDNTGNSTDSIVSDEAATVDTEAPGDAPPIATDEMPEPDTTAAD